MKENKDTNNKTDVSFLPLPQAYLMSNTHCPPFLSLSFLLYLRLHSLPQNFPSITAQEPGVTLLLSVILCFLIFSAALCLLLAFLSHTFLLQVLQILFPFISLLQHGSPVGHGPSGM